MGPISPCQDKPDPETVQKTNSLMRQYFAKTGRVPTVAQIKENLGSLISGALFSSLPPELQECIGLEPKMKGPTGSMWSSPSMQLLGKLNLTPMPLQRHAHVMTHEAILQIGQDIDDLVSKMREEEMEAKLEAQRKYYEQLLEEREQEVRKKIIREFFILSSFKMRVLFNEMESDFKEEWKKRESYLLIEAEKERVEGIQLLEEAMKCELDNVTRLHEDKYTSQLKFLVDYERAEANDQFHCRTIQMQAKWSKLFRDVKEAEKIKMRTRMADLQACHEAEIWSVMTKERESTDRVLYEVVKYGKNQLLKLSEEMEALRDKFVEACRQRDQNADDIEAWKCAITDMFIQFQKFINYVLKDVPGQAEYLLSLNEIMKNRKEFLARAFDFRGHHRLTDPKAKSEDWEDELVRPKRRPEGLRRTSQRDLDDEDDDRIMPQHLIDEENYLKNMVEGKRNNECMTMIKEMTTWVLNKFDGLKITPPPSSLYSSSGDAEDAQSNPPLLDPEILQYAAFMEKSLPQPLNDAASHKAAIESKVKTLTIKAPMNSIDKRLLDSCPEPFVANRVNSILNILDAHPHIKKILNKN